MYLIDNATASPTLPVSTAVGTSGYFTDGNPSTGLAPTVVPAEFLNMLMMELANAVTGAGIALDKSKNGQLLLAIRRLSLKTYVLSDTGLANAYTASNASPLLAGDLTSGLVQRLSVAHSNSGASTYAPDGLTAKPILGLGLFALQGGEMPINGIATMLYVVAPGVNGGNGAWVLLECTGAPQQVANASQSQHAATAGQVVTGSLGTATAGGTANAITASFPAAPTAFVAGQPFTIVAAAANTAAVAAILTLGGSAQASVAIVKGGNQSLAAGDIPAAGYPIELNYSSTYGALVMQNPATGLSTSSPQLMPASASVASNLITASLAATPMTYRGAAALPGTPVTVSQGALSIAMPSIAASLGATSGQATQIAVLSAYNGGSPVLCFANIAGGMDLSETGFISPTTISAGATSPTVIYSASAVSANSPYRVVEVLNATWISGTGWTLTSAQAAGGLALTNLAAAGSGTAISAPTRSVNTTYYNGSKERRVLINGSMSSGYAMTMTITQNGSSVNIIQGTTPQASASSGGLWLIPPFAAYSMSGTGFTSLNNWYEF